jgi:uncharacterized SAM-binding protein YcdF (DUF218 family)
VSVIVVNAVSALLLPPLNLVLACTAGLLLRRRHPRLGHALIGAALGLLVVLSTPVGALLLVAPLESRTAALGSAHDTGAQAIVVLGGGRISDAPEYDGNDIPSIQALARLCYAARLQRESGLPLLTTGGMPDGAAVSEAAIMARVLREEFSRPVAWTEGRSNTTAENAQFSAPILEQAGVRRILLVTDAIHMPRARAVFEKTGLAVIPAPTIFFSRERLRAFDFLPSGEGLRRSHYAMHEWMGLLWYRLRHRSDSL